MQKKNTYVCLFFHVRIEYCIVPTTARSHSVHYDLHKITGLVSFHRREEFGLGIDHCVVYPDDVSDLYDTVLHTFRPTHARLVGRTAHGHVTTMYLTGSTGIAKPMPANTPLGEYIAMLIPMSCPLSFNRGPPLLPGLMAASVCMTLVMGRPIGLRTSRPMPKMTPTVSVWSRLSKISCFYSTC